MSKAQTSKVSRDKFTFSCVQSTSFPWQVYFLVCTVNKFPCKTSLLSCVYSQHVFLEKFCCLCARNVVKQGKFVNFLPRSQLEILKINQSLYWLQGYTETLSMRAFSSMHAQIRISVSYLIDSFGLSDQNWPKWIHVFGHTYLKLQSFLFHLTIWWMCRVWPCLTDAP